MLLTALVLGALLAFAFLLFIGVWVLAGE